MRSPNGIDSNYANDHERNNEHEVNINSHELYWREDCTPDPDYGPRPDKVVCKARNLDELIQGLSKVKPKREKRGGQPRPIHAILRKDKQFDVIGVYIDRRVRKIRFFYGDEPKLLVPAYAVPYIATRVQWFAGRMLPWEDYTRYVIKILKWKFGASMRRRLKKLLGREYYDEVPQWIIDARVKIIIEILYPVIEKYIDIRVKYLVELDDKWAKRATPDVIQMAKNIMYVLLMEYAVNARPQLGYSELRNALSIYLDRELNDDDIYAINKAMLILNAAGLAHALDPKLRTVRPKRLVGTVIKLYPAVLMTVFVLLDWYGFAFRSDAVNIENYVMNRHDFLATLQSLNYYCCIKLSPEEKLHPWHMLKYYGAKGHEVEAYMTYVEEHLPEPPDQPKISNIEKYVQEVLARLGLEGTETAKLMYVYVMARLTGVAERLFRDSYLGHIMTWLVARLKRILGDYWKYALAVVQIVEQRMLGALFTTAKQLKASHSLSIGMAQIPSSRVSQNTAHSDTNLEPISHSDSNIHGNRQGKSGHVLRRVLSRLRRRQDDSGRDG